MRGLEVVVVWMGNDLHQSSGEGNNKISDLHQNMKLKGTSMFGFLMDVTNICQIVSIWLGKQCYLPPF